jgi:anti-sigma factor RsiW
VNHQFSCHHLVEEVIEEYLRNCLPEGDMHAIDEHVLMCADCQERLAEVAAFTWDLKQALRNLMTRPRNLPSLVPQFNERRREAREIRDESIRVFDRQGRPALGGMKAILVDFSQRGAGLLCGRRLRPGRRILVRDDRRLRLGVVRNSMPAGSLWRVGLEFASGSS